MTDFDLARAFLLKSGPSGLNLYDHLSKVLVNILNERPESSLERFEDISKEIKSQEFKVPSTIKVCDSSL